MKKFILLGTFCAASSLAFAGSDGAYLGADYGATTLAGSGGGSLSSFGFTGGWQFNDLYSIELGIRNLGKEKMILLADGYQTIPISRKMNSLHVAGVIRFPISKEVSIHSRLGYSRNSYKWDSPLMNGVGPKHQNSALFGVGSSYALTEKLSARIDWNRHHESFSNTSLSLFYKF
jgi:hypothetical protein